MNTVRTWLSRDDAFALSYHRAKAGGAKLAEPLTLDEWERLLAVECRRGSIAALRLWRETYMQDFGVAPVERPAPEPEPEQKDEPVGPFMEVDQLAQRRATA